MLAELRGALAIGERLVLSNAVAYDSWPVGFVASLGLPGTVESWDDGERLRTFLTEKPR